MNVGARSISTGANYASKAALRRACAADPSDVLFYSTSPFTPGEYRASELRTQDGNLYIVGPDPERSRKYYGTASRDLTGNLRIS